MNVDDRVIALEMRVEWLEGRIQILEDALIGSDLPPVEWRLTPAEARTFGCLMQRDLATKEQLLAASVTDLVDDVREIKIVDVFVCKMRKKLAPFGVEIQTRWGEGYFIDAATKRAVKLQIEAAREGGA